MAIRYSSSGRGTILADEKASSKLLVFFTHKKLLLLETLFLSFGFGLFFCLKTYSLWWDTADENVYYFQALLVRKGETPYTDFFFAHPPLRLLFLIPWQEWLGSTALSIKWVPAGLNACIGGLIYFLNRNHFGVWPALFGFFLYILSLDVLVLSGYFTGMELTVLFVLLAYLSALWRRDCLGAAFLFFAILSGYYAFPFAFAYFLFIGLQNKKNVCRPLALFIVMLGSFFLVASLWWGREFWQQTLFYHLQKPAKFVPFVQSPFAESFLRNPWLTSVGWLGFALSCLSFWLPSLRDVHSKARTGLRAAQIFLFCISVSLLLFGQAHSYYVYLAFPFFSFFVAYVVWAILKGTCVSSARGTRWRRVGLISILVIVFLTLIFGGQTYLIRKQGWYRSNTSVQYDWKPSIVLPNEIDEQMRLTLWRAKRDLDWPYYSLLHYLWESGQRFSALPEIIEGAVETCASCPLFGDDSVVPLVARLTGRLIWSSHVDTNFKRWQKQEVPFTGMREAENQVQVIIRRNKGLARHPDFYRNLIDHYVMKVAVRDPYRGVFEIWLPK